MKTRNIILARIKNKDKNTFREIYDEMYIPLVLFSNKYVNDLDYSSDVVQDVFMKLWEKPDCVNENISLRSFLYTAVKNKSIDHLRSKNISSMIYEDCICTESINEYNELEAEVHAKVHQSIYELPERSKEIIVMSMNGLTNKQIEEELGISVNTVKHSKKLSYKKLREKLKNLF